MSQKNKLTFLVLEKQEKDKYQKQRVIVNTKRRTFTSDEKKTKKRDFCPKDISRWVKSLKKEPIGRVINIRDSEYDDGKWGIVGKRSLTIMPRELIRKYDRDLCKKINDQAGKVLVIHKNKVSNKAINDFIEPIIESDCKLLLQHYRKMMLSGQININELLELHYCLLNGSQSNRPYDTKKRNDGLVEKILRPKTLRG